MSELKPCPFCGKSDLGYTNEIAEDEPYRKIAVVVFCRDCLSRGRATYPIGWCESKVAANQAWNDRKIELSLQSELSEMRKDLMAVCELYGNPGEQLSRFKGDYGYYDHMPPGRATTYEIGNLARQMMSKYKLTGEKR